MPTVVKQVAAQKQVKSLDLVVEVLLVFGLIGLVISACVASYGIDLTPGFF